LSLQVSLCSLNLGSLIL